MRQETGGRYAALARASFDLLVIGGGIIGCGIARDAALRGLKVALFEKADFGSGTSSRSTRLIHGGLRYLEMFDFGLVRQDLREREILLKTAPHRVQPLRFLVPLYHRSPFYRARLRAGMFLYDLLSYDKSLPNHQFLSREATLHAEPCLSKEGLQGAAAYYDAQCAFVERLCLDNVIDAVENGAAAFNYTEVTALHRSENLVKGLTVRDTQTGDTADFRANQIINASGPWLDRLTGKLTHTESRSLRLTKGVHFAAPAAVQNALALFSQQDGRLFFVIPWLGVSWVGTTDTDYSGDPDAVRADGDDVRYLQAGVEPALPCADWNDIYYTTAGLRALVRSQHSNARESEVSRKHRLIVHTKDEGWEGLFSVLGGKITAYRDIAEETINAVSALRLQHFNERKDATLRQLRKQGQHAVIKLLGLRPCVTRTRPLPGGDFDDTARLQTEIRSVASQLGFNVAQADNLLALYGTRAVRLFDLVRFEPGLGEPLAASYPDIKAEIAYAISYEWTTTVSDFMLRRSMLGFTPDQGQGALEAVARTMGAELGWPEERISAECESYRAHIAMTQAFRQDGC
jgi:glycerol-3-phosphate dehydrogenase